MATIIEGEIQTVQISKKNRGKAPYIEKIFQNGGIGGHFFTRHQTHFIGKQTNNQ